MIRRTGIELEAAFNQAVQFTLFDRARLAIERDDVNQQRSGRQEYPVSSNARSGSALGATISAMNWRSPSSIIPPAKIRGSRSANMGRRFGFHNPCDGRQTMQAD
jgi:hypothetical protein